MLFQPNNYQKERGRGKSVHNYNPMDASFRCEPDHHSSEQNGHGGMGPDPLRRNSEEAAAIPEAGGLQGG